MRRRAAEKRVRSIRAMLARGCECDEGLVSEIRFRTRQIGSSFNFKILNIRFEIFDFVRKVQN
jgi:hypothetical protein